MADVTILGDMGRRYGLAGGDHHLVQRSAGREVGVELAAEFAQSARACIETVYDGGVNVFQGRLLEKMQGLCRVSRSSVESARSSVAAIRMRA